MCKEMKSIYVVISLVLACLLGTSCSTTESLTYFENADGTLAEGIGSNKYGVKIVPDDELKIVVTLK